MSVQDSGCGQRIQVILFRRVLAFEIYFAKGEREQRTSALLSSIEHLPVERHGGDKNISKEVSDEKSMHGYYSVCCGSLRQGRNPDVV